MQPREAASVIHKRQEKLTDNSHACGVCHVVIDNGNTCDLDVSKCAAVRLTEIR